MSLKYSNVSEVPLSLAVFLASDNYDYSDDKHTISATALIKPIRQLILAARVPEAYAVQDLTQTVASRIGSAIHDGIERAWTGNYKAAMAALGYPDKVISSLLINPTEDQLFEGCIPVYLEQRAHKTVGKWTVSGKFDFVAEGRVEDFKTTSTYNAIFRTNDDNYVLQGSIYRWLNPNLITNPQMAIQFLFTDWSSAKAKQDPNYPQRRYQQRVFDLKSIPETDTYIRQKLALLDKYWTTPEQEIPPCTDAELWRSDPVYKYYRNPEKTSRSTKNFDNLAEALARKAKDGNVGIVREQPGQVAACRYCPAFPVCTQKDALIASGDLVV